MKIGENFTISLSKLIQEVRDRMGKYECLIGCFVVKKFKIEELSYLKNSSLSSVNLVFLNLAK